MYQIGYYPLTFLSNAANQLVIPIIFGIAGRGEHSSRTKRALNVSRTIAGITALVSVLIALLSIAFHREIVLAITSQEYVAKSHLLPIIVMAAGIFVTAQALSVESLIRERPTVLIRPKVISSVLGAAASVMGAVMYGVEGVVYAMLLFSICLLVMIFSAQVRQRIGAGVHEAKWLQSHL